MAKTRNLLAHVPDEKFAWRPHDKSSTIGQLANHLAAIPIFAAAVVNGTAKRMPEAASNPELLSAFDKNMAIGREAPERASDDHLAAMVPLWA